MGELLRQEMHGNTTCISLCSRSCNNLALQCEGGSITIIIYSVIQHNYTHIRQVPYHLDSTLCISKTCHSRSMN